MTTSTSKYVTTEYGKQNMFGTQTQPWIDETDRDYNHWKVAEQMNGRLAMIGLFAAVINYGFTGWIVPGIV